MKTFFPVEDIQKRLLLWFEEFGRHWIPWKLTLDGSLPEIGERISPYGIFIAEIMLQQTQLKVVLPYWRSWMSVFPDLDTLAEADQQQVLKQWQGLGYYSRAKRLHASSKLLVELLGKGNSFELANWPSELNQWMSLPGIGRTTAGSILSSAFDLPYPILDGNVKRILSRLIANNNTYIKDKKTFWNLSSELVPTYNPRDFNQALMDLGSTVCTVKSPQCVVCPINDFCLAYLKYDPIDFPKKVMKKVIPLEEIGIGLIFNEDRELLIDQRHESSSMGGFWEFPGGKREIGESIEKTIEREIREELSIEIQIGEKLISFDHMYSHKKLRFFVYICDLKSGEPKPLASQKFLWVPPSRLFDFPFPAANTKIISELQKHLEFLN